MIKIVIVDDHYLMVSGLKMIISISKDMDVVGTANDAESAMEIVKTKKPDVLILDISLSGHNGLDIIPKIKTISAGTKILILTMYEDRQYINRAFENGASGYIPKKAVEEDLVYSIKTVARGEMYIYPSLINELIGKGKEKNGIAKKIEDNLNEANIGGNKDVLLWKNLSSRESEVLIFVVKGFSNKEIGEKLFINEKTAATHRLRGMEKLGISNKSDLVDLVLFRLKLLEKNKTI